MRRFGMEPERFRGLASARRGDVVTHSRWETFHALRESKLLHRSVVMRTTVRQWWDNLNPEIAHEMFVGRATVSIFSVSLCHSWITLRAGTAHHC
jgi:hypothetical protein